jgi:putative phage-type endonuclease
VSALLVPTASEAEWLAARDNGITASEIAVVMGLSPYESPFALYHRKRGDLERAGDNVEMRVGRHFESLVCEMFAEQHPEFIVGGDGRSLYAHPGRPWQMATPDRLVWERDNDRFWPAADFQNVPDAVAEAKTSATYDGWGEDGSDEIPVHYRCQALWQMDVMGVETAFIPCLFLHSRKLRVYEITMDADARADLKLLREEAELFLERHLRPGREPDVDWRPATGEALKQLHSGLEDTDVTISRTLERQYKAACAAAKKAEQRKSLAENRIRARLGDGRRALGPDGQVVATRQVYDVKEHVRKACTVNKLVPARTAKEAR